MEKMITILAQLKKEKTYIIRNLLVTLACIMIGVFYITICCKGGETFRHITQDKGTKTAMTEDYQKGIAKEILRLHVIANSDSNKDQALKMKVKEEVVSYVSNLTRDCGNAQQVKEVVCANIMEIASIAETIVRREGYDYNIDAEVTECYFPVKTYGEAVFPPGYYQALRVKIGKAEGKNWWCVLYPNLCFVDTAYGVLEEEQKEELKKVLTREEYESIFTADSEDIEISFGFWDWFRE